MNDESLAYTATAFHYIHQNPMKAGLVKKMETWEFSSFKDYTGLRNGNLCNKDIAYLLLDFNKKTFYEDSYKIIPDNIITLIE